MGITDHFEIQLLSRISYTKFQKHAPNPFLRTFQSTQKWKRFLQELSRTFKEKLPSCSALEVFLNDIRYINPGFTDRLTYLLLQLLLQLIQGVQK